MRQRGLMLGGLVLLIAAVVVLRLAGQERGQLLVMGMAVTLVLILGLRRRRPVKLSPDDRWIRAWHESGLPVEQGIACTLALREHDLAIAAGDRTFCFPYGEIADARAESEERREVGGKSGRDGGMLILSWLADGEETPIVLRTEGWDEAELMAVHCRFRVRQGKGK